MRFASSSTILATIGAASLAFGCHHAAPPAAMTPAPSSANQDSIARENARRDSVARAQAARRTAAAKADSVRRANDARLAAIASARETLTDAIHFEFDGAAILAPDRAVMDQKAAIMRANPSLQIRIVGDTDERGSDEYNLALGMRRAAAAKQYLTARGVDVARIATASNGEEDPVCRDPDEICWIQNRRAEFAITAGGDVVVAGIR